MAKKAKKDSKKESMNKPTEKKSNPKKKQRGTSHILHYFDFGFLIW